MKEKEGVMHNQEKVKFNVDMTVPFHKELKMLCAEERIRMTDFVRNWVEFGIKETKKQHLRKILLQGFKDVEEGRYTRISSEQLKQWEKELDDESD